MEKNFLRKIWARDAPWPVIAVRTALLAAGLVSALPYGVIQTLPGEAIPEIPARSLRQFYRAAVDFDRIRLHSSPGSDAFLSYTESKAATFGSVILLKQDLHDAVRTGEEEAVYTLAHEIGHVYQNKKSYFVAYFKNQFQNMKTSITGELLYDYSLRAGKERDRKFDDYGIEQQAGILADYYNLRNGRTPKYNIDTAKGRERENLYRDVLSDFLKERGPPAP